MKPQLLLTLMLITGMLALGLAATCGYQYLSTASLANQITAQQATLASAKDYAAELARAQAHGQLLAAKLAKRPASWTWSDQFPVMVLQISHLVAGSGTRIETLQPAPETERQGVARYPLRLSLHTNLLSLTTLLQRIRNASPVLSIDHLAVHTGQFPGDPLEVDLTLSSYVMKPAAVKGGK